VDHIIWITFIVFDDEISETVCKAAAGMSRSIVIDVQNLGLTYRVRRSLFTSTKVLALSNLSFEVRKGETLGVLGRNGAGKSTLLRVLAGIFTPDQGAITVNAQSISLMTLQLGFDPALSGRENAIFGGMLLGFSRREVEQRIEEIRDFSGLLDAFNEPVKSYSSGMVSRLSFSVAINLSPDVMLLDEVLAVGDEEFRDKAYNAMLDKISSDQTTVLVSHSMPELERLCDRAILLDKGQLIHQGDPIEVIEKYRDGSSAR
jgi:lipopolysaccharide transport system ATP-binding protein